MKSAVMFCEMSGSGSSLYKQNGTMYVRVPLLPRSHENPKYTTVVDWLRAVQFFSKTVQKRGNSVQKEETNQAF